MMAEFEMSLSEQKLMMNRGGKWRRRELKGVRHIGENSLLEQPELVWQVATVSKPMFVISVGWGIILDDQKNMEMNERSIAA